MCENHKISFFNWLNLPATVDVDRATDVTVGFFTLHNAIFKPELTDYLGNLPDSHVKQVVADWLT